MPLSLKIAAMEHFAAGKMFQKAGRQFLSSISCQNRNSLIHCCRWSSHTELPLFLQKTNWSRNGGFFIIYFANFVSFAFRNPIALLRETVRRQTDSSWLISDV